MYLYIILSAIYILSVISFRYFLRQMYLNIWKHSNPNGLDIVYMFCPVINTTLVFCFIFILNINANVCNFFKIPKAPRK